MTALNKIRLSAAMAASVLLCASPARAERPRHTLNVRTECIGDRCVLRDQFGNRLGTVTTDSYSGRASVRDANDRLRARVTPQPNGTYRVEPK